MEQAQVGSGLRAFLPVALLRSPENSNAYTGSANKLKTHSGVRLTSTKSAPLRKSPSPAPRSQPAEPVAGPSRLPGEGTSPRASETHVWGLARYGIPEPDPDAPCNPDVEARLAGFHAAREAKGESFNSILMRNKMFRNPHILEKLVSFIEVDDQGSNFGTRWDRAAMATEGSAKVIGAEQRRMEEERERAKAPGKRSAIDFAPASSGKPPPSSSKWDAGTRRDRDERRERERDGDRDDRDRPKSRRRSHSPPGRPSKYG